MEIVSLSGTKFNLLSINPPTKEMYGILSSTAIERVFKTVNKYKNTTLQN
jgi:hypothetical protein